MDLCYPYQLPPLPYSYEALAPKIGDETLHFHHDKHFQTYVDNLNTALSDCPECQSRPLSQLLTELDRIPEAKRTAIRNNGGGIYNHVLYFAALSPQGGGRPSGELAQAMERAFGPYDANTLIPRFTQRESIKMIVSGGPGKQSQFWVPFPQVLKPVSAKIAE